MNSTRIRSQREANDRRQPLWLRVVAYFAMALIGAASTAQVCHSHEDALQPGTSQASKTAPGSAALANPNHDSLPGKSNKSQSDQDDSNSAVRCPLCVAMHSALPVTGHLPQVALLALVAVVPASDGIGRRFSWRFEMASRPPPSARWSA